MDDGNEIQYSLVQFPLVGVLYPRDGIVGSTTKIPRGLGWAAVAASEEEGWASGQGLSMLRRGV